MFQPAMPFIEQVPSPSPPPPAIYNTPEHNKENIPPFDFINQFYLPNIIPEFNTRFKTFTQYQNYCQWHLNDWLNNVDFKVFDGAYCHHCLLLRQKEGLQTLIKQINTQLKELDKQDQCQLHNICIIIPNLQAKGLAVHITDTLGQPDIVGEPPFSYPVSLWKQPRPTQPFTPIRPPTPTLPIPEPKKKRRYREKCPKCKREYLYNHVAWAWGYKSGYTCCCPEEETPSKPSSSSQQISMNPKWPSLQNKLCQFCGTNPAHAQQFCLEYKCPHCHLHTPEHLPQQCKWQPQKPRQFLKAKEEPVPPKTLNWDYDGYYKIEGYEDRNLNGEN